MGDLENKVSQDLLASNFIDRLVGLDRRVRVLEDSFLAAAAAEKRYARVLRGTGDWTPNSLADGVADSTTVAVEGARLGDLALATFVDAGANDVILSAHVQGADVVRVVLVNHTGNTGTELVLGAGVLTVYVFRLVGGL